MVTSRLWHVERWRHTHEVDYFYFNSTIPIWLMKFLIKMIKVPAEFQRGVTLITLRAETYQGNGYDVEFDLYRSKRHRD